MIPIYLQEFGENGLVSTSEVCRRIGQPVTADFIECQLNIQPDIRTKGRAAYWHLNKIPLIHIALMEWNTDRFKELLPGLLDEGDSVLMKATRDKIEAVIGKLESIK